ncbi:nucleotidyltransferase family protein [Roseomonas terrae]|uniref:Nucleotidyltransferase family protein n=1 Tax=Neoroseomonas terrae TaxID=424799 RepID=A0ABS5EDJ7_9PROT|nr:nucleotidyltransferase family protein [Neoroseomonas terrae]MBR0649086.1 nucleotidyltransferase family protein [Neoroseomonas terrae]
MIALTHAMVLAAGLGTRMRPLTDDRPKPLLELEGRSLLDHALDRLQAAGVTDAVVNAHWRGEQIEAAMARRTAPRITLQHEPALLETGGSVRMALPALGDAPFAVVNGDAFWLDGPSPALRRLAGAFDPAEMDALLLMVRTTQVEGRVDKGDFLLDPIGRMRRPKEREIAPYIYAGVQILSPALFEGAPDGPFSLNRLYDRAIENGRLYGLVHDGVWFHLSTPQDLYQAEATMRAGLARALF